MVGILELQVTCEEFVTSCWRPLLPEVPTARSCPVCPVADSDSELGLTAIAVNGSGVPPITVNVAVPVATVPSELVAMAVMVEAPWLTPVASPEVLMVAICVLLELQVTLLLKSSVAPEEVVPIAMNWLVSPGEATD